MRRLALRLGVPAERTCWRRNTRLLVRRGSETRWDWGSRDRRRRGRKGSRRETIPRVLVGVRVWCCEAVRERAEEDDDQVFFVIAQAEVPGRHVDVVLDFRLGPAGHLFDGSRRAVSRLDGVSVNISRVIERDEFLQTLHIAIMKERLLEVG